MEVTQANGDSKNKQSVIFTTKFSKMCPCNDRVFLASQDALEVMRVTHSLSHLLTESLSKRSH